MRGDAYFFCPFLGVLRIFLAFGGDGMARPRKFKTVSALQKAINAYFNGLDKGWRWEVIYG